MNYNIKSFKKKNLLILSLISFFYSCNTGGEQSKENINDKCISYFNIILKDFFEEDNPPDFEKIVYQKPQDFDILFYDNDLSSASFFVELVKEHEKEIESLYLFIDTSDYENGYSKFYFLNKINDMYYIEDGYSFYCDFSFLNNCELPTNKKVDIDLNPKPAFNTFDTNLFGLWKSNDGIEIYFEENQFIVEKDTFGYEKLGNHLVYNNRDTLATIRAISMNNLILNCDFIENGEMIYYQKMVMHPLSKTENYRK